MKQSLAMWSCVRLLLLPLLLATLVSPMASPSYLRLKKAPPSARDGWATALDRAAMVASRGKRDAKESGEKDEEWAADPHRMLRLSRNYHAWRKGKRSGFPRLADAGRLRSLFTDGENGYEYYRPARSNPYGFFQRTSRPFDDAEEGEAASVNDVKRLPSPTVMRMLDRVRML